MVQCVLLVQDPVERGLGCKVDALVSQPRDDLLGRQIAVLEPIGGIQHPFPLRRAELVARRRLRAEATIKALLALLTPTLNRAGREPQYLATARSRRAPDIDRLIDQLQ